MNPWFLSISLAYLLGSIPFGYLLVRIFRHEDIRTSGSGNIGATNVARSGAKGLGIATLILDLGKAFTAVVFAFLIAAHAPAFAGLTRETAQAQAYDLAVMAAVAAILGHVFPLWLRFRGGKGVASALGVTLALSPRTAVGILTVFVLVVALTRIVSLASILAAVTLPALAWFLASHRSLIAMGGFTLIALLVIVKHRQNMSRLLNGTESRFGSKPKPVTEAAA